MCAWLSVDEASNVLKTKRKQMGEIFKQRKNKKRQYIKKWNKYGVYLEVGSDKIRIQNPVTSQISYTNIHP